MSKHHLYTAASAGVRLRRLEEAVLEQPASQPSLVLGPTLEACDELVRQATSRSKARATFGLVRTTPQRLAAWLAGPLLAERGLRPSGGRSFEAVCARALALEAGEGGLGPLAAVVDTPGLARALARTVGELRAAGVGEGLPPWLERLALRVEGCLRAGALADRAAVLALAREALATRPWPAAVAGPAVWIDLPVPDGAIAALLHDLAAGCAGVVASAHPADPDLDRLAAVLQGCPEALPEPTRTDLERGQAGLFKEEGTGERDLGPDGSVTVLSAAGEARECAEVVRRLLHHASRGIPFDAMAVLLPSSAHRDVLEEAFARAEMPAWFASGLRRPDPAGRAFLALLHCAVQGLSASRFAEYLSLGELPRAQPDGSPPAASDVFVPPDEDEVSLQDDEAQAEDTWEPLAEAREDTGQAVIDGTLRSPRRWERLLVDAAVIQGLDRWERRLGGLAERLELDLAPLDLDDPVRARLERNLSELDRLRRFALPLLRDLQALPTRERWSTWLTALGRLATRALRRPDRVLAVLGELAPLGDLGPVGLEEVLRVLRPHLSALRRGASERRYGKVFVGTIDQARGLGFRVVVLPGVTERVFPAPLLEDPLLLDDQRRMLPAPSGGLRLDTRTRRLERERLRLHLAMGAAGEAFIVSWSRLEVQRGRPRVPSFYALEVLRAAEGRLPDFDELERRAAAQASDRMGWPAPEDPLVAVDRAEVDLALAARGLGAPARGLLRYLMDENPHLARSLRQRARQWRPKWGPADGLAEPSPLAREALQAHHPDRRSVSTSALQDFVACPYRFHLRNLVRLEPREEPEPLERLDPLTRGSLLHEAQYVVLTRLRAAELLPLSPERLGEALRLLDGAVAEVAEAAEERLAPAIQRVWLDGVEAIRSDLVEWLRRTAADTKWTPWRFELAFGLRGRRQQDPDSSPESVRLECGVLLNGSIDLVERGPGDVLRVTDHKTGRVKLPAKGRTGRGRVLQPIFYALAAERLFPALEVVEGRLYHCTYDAGFAERVVPVDGLSRQAAEQVARALRRRLEAGDFQPFPAEDACRTCDYAAVCGPHAEHRAALKLRDPVADIVRIREVE